MTDSTPQGRRRLIPRGLTLVLTLATTATAALAGASAADADAAAAPAASAAPSASIYAAVAAAAADPAISPAHAGQIPATVVLNGLQLAITRAEVRAGVPALKTELATLTKAADSYLTQGPWSVMDKPQLPPSGNKHDYLSEAPYWWPTEPVTAANPWGEPYVQKDGVVNPAIYQITDHSESLTMFTAVNDLTLAWYYTGNRAYAARAELDLRTWFIDPATMMDPDLNYTQFIPGVSDGRGIGIIDFSQQFTDIIDASAILDAGAPSWTRSDARSMQSWFKQFLSWLQTSPNAAQEQAQTNNHGSFFDAQEAALALATGNWSLARSIVTTAETTRLNVQLAADGSEPLEISRTRSWHYSNFNLTALLRLAQVGEHVGVNLWAYTTPTGGTLRKSVDFLIPAATGAAAWGYPELAFQQFAADDSIHADAAVGDPAARAALALIPSPPGGSVWDLDPAPEQLDPVVT